MKNNPAKLRFSDGAGSRRHADHCLRREKLILHTDGCCRGNPGPAGIGVVIRDSHKKVLKELSEYIGEGTNNIAEYRALIRGLEEAGSLGADELAIFMDSELVVKQLNGEYRVKDDGMKELFKKALEGLRRFKSFEIKHVDRSKNKEADRLANKAINLAGV